MFSQSMAFLLFCVFITLAMNSVSTLSSSLTERRHSPSLRPSPFDLPFEYSLNSIWIKHDRAVNETFHISIECQQCCQCISNPSECGNFKCLPEYSGTYLDGPFAGINTFNITMVGDLMSGIGQYANFVSEGKPAFCPAPFSLIMTFDPNVVFVSYGSTFGTVCGDYTGDSAVYYRKM